MSVNQRTKTTVNTCLFAVMFLASALSGADTLEKYGDLPSIVELHEKALISSAPEDVRLVSLRCSAVYEMLAQLFEAQNDDPARTQSMKDMQNSFFSAAIAASMANKTPSPDVQASEMNKVSAQIEHYTRLIIARMRENEWQEGHSVFSDNELMDDINYCRQLASAQRGN